MPRTKFSATDLSQLHRQLGSWRQSQPQCARLPEAVWASAAALATTHGVSCVARTLGLGYTKLKQRATQAPGVPAPTTPPPTFVELQLDDSLRGTCRSCRVELSDPAGGKMTVHLPLDSPAMLRLAEAFWRRAL
jgi:hypothetical protein